MPAHLIRSFREFGEVFGGLRFSVENESSIMEAPERKPRSKIRDYRYTHEHEVIYENGLTYQRYMNWLTKTALRYTTGENDFPYNPTVGWTNLDSGRYRIPNIVPTRITSAVDINSLIQAYKTLTPGIYKSFKKCISAGIDPNILFQQPESRKFPMHPLVTDKGMQMQVAEDWNYFFFKGGVVPTDTNYKFMAFPIYNKEEWFLHEASKKENYRFCQEHNLIDYASNGQAITVQGNVVPEVILETTRFWTIQSKYLKLFVYDSFNGRKYICNLYFELGSGTDYELIHIKYNKYPFQLFLSGRLMEAYEVLETLMPSPKSRPFLRSVSDPEYSSYLKAVMTVKRPKLVFKTKGRKLGNIKELHK